MPVYKEILVVTTLSFCNNSNNTTPTQTGFSCEEYEIMLDVEAELAQDCTDSSECTQVLFEDTCESNSLLTNASFDTEYLFDLYEEGTNAGCELALPINTDCSKETPTCIQSQCRWN